MYKKFVSKRFYSSYTTQINIRSVLGQVLILFNYLYLQPLFFHLLSTNPVENGWTMIIVRYQKTQIMRSL